MAQSAPDGEAIRKFRIVQNESGRSVGYRVKSIEGTQFRIWATNVLKGYLVKGYALNERKLLEKGQERELLNIVNEYSNSLTFLFQYDNKQLEIRGVKQPTFELTYDGAREFIHQIKEKLIERGEARALFGQEISHKLASILGALYQTFDKKDLYPSVEEKAANLLYLVIKDHPFGDGNKRIGSLLFISYLDRNDFKCYNLISNDNKEGGDDQCVTMKHKHNLEQGSRSISRKSYQSIAQAGA